MKQSMLSRLWRDQSGVVPVEYAFIVAFVAILAAGGMAVVKPALKDFFEQQGDSLEETGRRIPIPPCMREGTC